MPFLLPGSNGILAMKVAKLTGYPICYTQLFKQPDGEKYLRFATDIRGEDVIIFNSMHPNPDEILFETVLITETALDLGANSVSCVFPYFAYARTLEREIKGEAVPLRIVAKILKNSGMSRIYTVDFHLNDSEIFDLEFTDLTAMKMLANYCRDEFSEDFTVVAPDEKAAFWAEIFSREIEANMITLRKIRIDAENVIIESQKMKIKGDVVVVDDIISTGATVCQAARVARKAGCSRVFAASTHAILTSDAMKRMIEAGIEDVVSTDTVQSPVSRVSVSKIIAERIKSDFE
jgi:ribose-phosphate pyrophosphokinase